MGKKDLAEAPKNKKTTWLLLAVILILTSTNVWAFFSLKNRKANDMQPSENKFPLLNPARRLIDQKDLIINLQPLRDSLNKEYDTNHDISIYFEYLPTGASIDINKEAEFYPASLLKVPVAMAVAKKIERGEWKWSNELVLMSADKDDDFGSLYKEPSNSTFTIEELVKRSLAESDNTAHFILVRNLERLEIDNVYEHMGLKGFLDTNGNLSAKRYSVIMRALYNSSYLDEDSSQKLLSYLSQSPFNFYLQAALPEDITVAHKIGTSKEKDMHLDSGLVYVKHRPYLLTVMIKTKDEQFAKEKMKNISEKVYNYIKNYQQ